MKNLLILITSIVLTTATAQQSAKVVLHLQSSDSLVHKSIVNQISNLKKSLPDATIELVCHGPGLEFLLKDKSRYVNRLDKMKLKDVSYVGCEFTMSQRNYKKEDLVPFAQTVPLGIAEIVKKQAEGWLYVKMGF
jgi:intracellular sulfur oxidation DsrE/DsrF family protein